MMRACSAAEGARRLDELASPRASAPRRARGGHSAPSRRRPGHDQVPRRSGRGPPTTVIASRMNGKASWMSATRMMTSSSRPAEVAGEQAEGDPERRREATAESPISSEMRGAVEDAAQDVAAELVGPEEMSRAPGEPRWAASRRRAMSWSSGSCGARVGAASATTTLSTRMARPMPTSRQPVAAERRHARARGPAARPSPAHAYRTRGSTTAYRRSTSQVDSTKIAAMTNTAACTSG